MYDVALAAATCVAEMLGGGVIALPYSISVLSPILGIFVLLFAGAMTLYTGWLLGDLFLHTKILHFDHELLGPTELEMMEVYESTKSDDEHENEESTKSDDEHEDDEHEDDEHEDEESTKSGEEHILFPSPPYAMIARESIGIWGECLTYGSQIITLIGVDVVFLILCGINISLMAEFSNVDLPVSSGIFIIALLSLFLSFLMSDVTHFSPLIWIAVFTTFTGIIFRWVSIVEFAPDHPAEPPEFSWYSCLEAFGVITFSFGGHAGFPSYQQNMKESYRKYFVISVSIAYAYILILEVPFCATVAILYKGDLGPNFLESLPSNNVVSFIILFLFTIHMLTAISTLVPPVAHNLFHLVRTLGPAMEEENLIVVSMCSPFIVQLIAVIIALTFRENFFFIMALLGNTTITLCTFILPAVFYLNHPNIERTLIHEVACFLCIVFGTFIGGSSIIISIWSMVK